MTKNIQATILHSNKLEKTNISTNRIALSKKMTNDKIKDLPSFAGICYCHKTLYIKVLHGNDVCG